jgi:glycosyltransferase involved in cell wall biosynthesis
MGGGSGMKLLLLNYSYLSAQLRALGHQVLTVGLEPDCDLVLTLADYRMEQILKKIRFQPDWVIFIDSLQRMIPRGLENCPYPLALFCLDSTINRFWQIPFAQISHLVLFDQKPESVLAQAKGLNSLWFPLCADTSIYNPQRRDKAFDISFIGNRNPHTRQKRENILRALSGRFNLTIFDGNPPLDALQTAEVYRKSKLVLNENLFPAVNLRLFEAMACGSAVLSEDTAPGLEDLFQDSKELITYNPENLLEKTAYYLEKGEEREAIAFSGCHNILNFHNLEKRAKELITLLENAPEKSHIDDGSKKCYIGKAFLNFALKWPQKDRDALVEAERFLKEAVADYPSYSALLALGKIFTLKSDFHSAMKSFEEATLLSAGDYRAPLCAGIIASMMEDTSSEKRLLSLAVDAIGEAADRGDLLRAGSASFHRFWGKCLAERGDFMDAGLMKYHLPIVFWSGMEHLRKAAETDSAMWEVIGDHLMRASALDQALLAYKNSASTDSAKIATAEKTSYLSLSENIVPLPAPPLLTLCMIVKDEARNLAELLPLVKSGVDQIVIADTGSQDDTIAVAKSFGAEVFSIPWSDNFAEARNRTLRLAKGRYIIYLDGDDRLDPIALHSLRNDLNGSEDKIFLTPVLDRLSGEVCLQKRIFPRKPELRFRGAIHEQVIADPANYTFVEAPLTIYHQGYDEKADLKNKSHRNLKIIGRELKKNPDDLYLHYHSALCYLNLQQDLKAIESLRKVAFPAASENTEAELQEHSLILLSKIFLRLSDIETAMKLLQTLLGFQPYSALGHYYLGKLYFEEQLYSECRGKLEEFFRLDFRPKGIPVAVDKILSWAHYYLAKCLEHQGHFNRSVEEYSQAAGLSANPAKIYGDIGRVYYKIHNLSEAKKFLELCLLQHPSDRSAQHLYEKTILEGTLLTIEK